MQYQSHQTEEQGCHHHLSCHMLQCQHNSQLIFSLYLHSVLYYVQCFDAVGRVTERPSEPQKDLRHYPERLPSGTSGGRKSQLANPGSPGKRPSRQKYLSYYYYRISSNRSPQPLLAQLCQTPGLYSRPGLY